MQAKRGDRNTTEIIQSLLPPHQFPKEGTKNDSNRPIYTQFEHLIEQLGRNNTPLL
jgi:hypothetical protein